QNDPNNPYQRDNIIERKGRVDIRCEHKAIVHGFYSDDVDDLCTLIVLGFRFDPNSVARRIKEAHVVVKFAAMDKNTPDPEVLDMYPNGQFSFAPSTHQETLVRGGGVSVGGIAAGVPVGGELKLEHTIERDISDAAGVRGSIDLRGRNWGAKNSVSWTLWENKSAKTGVLPSMPAAILLKRRDMRQFKATFTIKIAADSKTTLGSAFKTDPKDDDVWYDPER
ncbi:hypothetical protein B0H67DRAFT_468483, partial [Lasiosphaeris hirsuta]